MINYPHPLLARGLVVLDTPGLNAIGTEPELTLGLLPGAHAALFLLGADAGVTKSDLSVWNEHLGGQSMACFVVLNKVDMLADPLLTDEQNEALVQKQCEVTAQTLQMPRDRVFPVSARTALHARLNNNEADLAKSRLPALEAALTNELLPARQQVLTHALVQGVERCARRSTRACATSAARTPNNCSSCAACAARAARACATCSIACRKTPPNSSAASRA
jgi:hypothetical protein